MASSFTSNSCNRDSQYSSTHGCAGLDNVWNGKRNRFLVKELEGFKDIFVSLPAWEIEKTSACAEMRSLWSFAFNIQKLWIIILPNRRFTVAPHLTQVGDKDPSLKHGNTRSCSCGFSSAACAGFSQFPDMFEAWKGRAKPIVHQTHWICMLAGRSMKDQAAKCLMCWHVEKSCESVMTFQQPHPFVLEAPSSILTTALSNDVAVTDSSRGSWKS